MLYTRKGDTGTTKLFNCPQGVRLSKSDAIFTALGTLDELNCSIGFAKVLANKSRDMLGLSGKRTSYALILEQLQNSVFIVQAELAGSVISLKKSDVEFAEAIVGEVETLLPPITSFIVSGGGETGAFLDICRTIARRAERTVIIAKEKEECALSSETLQFLNRLSSVLYALARFANYQEGYIEKAPSYHYK
jgi:ATP:cob(I)alamin adenosyltransferase